MKETRTPFLNETYSSWILPVTNPRRPRCTTCPRVPLLGRGRDHCVKEAKQRVSQHPGKANSLVGAVGSAVERMGYMKFNWMRTEVRKSTATTRHKAWRSVPRGGGTADGASMDAPGTAVEGLAPEASCCGRRALAESRRGPLIVVYECVPRHTRGVSFSLSGRPFLRLRAECSTGDWAIVLKGDYAVIKTHSYVRRD